MIRLIAAVDTNRGLAKNGIQPWKLPMDEAYFYTQTLQYGGAVLMGQKTYQVIGHPLKNRRNFILSRQPKLHVPGTEVVHDLESFLKNLKGDIWIIGGASVYTQTIKYADELYLTQIEADFACDQFFPDFKHAFELVQQSPVQHEASLDFLYCRYKRI